MKVTVVWTADNARTPCDVRRLHGNQSRIVVISDPIDLDSIVLDVVGNADVVYVVDHAQKSIRLLSSPTDTLPILRNSAVNPSDVKSRSTRYKICKTVDVDEALLSNYEAFVNAVNAAK